VPEVDCDHGRQSAEYAAYAEAIRQEYAWVPPPQYAEGRSRVLRGFVDRPALFTHAEFQQRFGTQARANLSWEISELDASMPLTPGQSQAAIL
jgi:predicted metal-dependent HD superfamily phosphohydrolase